MSDKDWDQLPLGELAFEEGFPENPADDLWRLESTRHPVVGSMGFQKKSIRCVNWFVTEEAAKKHGAWIEGSDGIERGKVLSITHYKKV